jgi:hypothetical protein
MTSEPKEQTRLHGHMVILAASGDVDGNWCLYCKGSFLGKQLYQGIICVVIASMNLALLVRHNYREDMVVKVQLLSLLNK